MFLLYVLYVPQYYSIHVSLYSIQFVFYVHMYYVLITDCMYFSYMYICSKV